MPRAGLDPATVAEAAAAVSDETGIDRLSMNLVAERLGVKTPSLYKHVDSLAALTRQIAVIGANQMGDALRDAVQGVSGRDALAAAAHAFRAFVKQYPGRYAATTGARPTGPDDELAPALRRGLDPLRAVLRGYQLDETQEIHSLRMIRSVLHGFADLERSDGFQYATDVDETFAWMIDFIDQGLSGKVTT